MDEVVIGKKSFPALVAITSEEQNQGLMWKKWPPPVMAFPSNPQVRKFWMKNTPSPLDIVFCRGNRIISICKGEPFSTSLIGPDDATDLVIEFPAGTIESIGVGVGDAATLKYSAKTAARACKQAMYLVG